MASSLSIRNTDVVRSLIVNRELIWTLTKRDFFGRYKGSILGVAWSLFHPLLMLAIYTFVFGVALGARWGTQDDSQVGFAVVLFSGLIVHGFFAECLQRAPALVVTNPSYVKKVVFPIEVLTWVTIHSALAHFIVSLGVLLMFCVLLGLPLPPSMLLVPVVLLPLVLLALGLTWFLSALGVYLRDLSHVVSVITTVLLFLSPVFYPREALPEAYQILITLNPLTLPIEQFRAVVLLRSEVDWGAWSLSMALSVVVCYAGFWWFQKTRRGFSDAL